MPADLVAKDGTGSVRLGDAAVALGGLELDPMTMVEVTEEWREPTGRRVGRCSSGTPRRSSRGSTRRSPRRSSATATSPPRAMFPPKAAAIPDGNGAFTVSGRWSFNSGCPHADWYSNGVMVMDGAGPRMHPEGRPDWRFAFYPKDGVEIIETWNALGLRGTGSHDTQVAGIRRPRRADGRTVLRAGAARRTALAIRVHGHPRPDDERLPARGRPPRHRRVRRLRRIQRCADRASSSCTTRSCRSPSARPKLRSAQPTPSARRLRLGAGDRVPAGDPIAPEQSARVQLAMKQSIRTGIEVVDGLWAVGGARVVYDTNPLQRCFRDIHTASQHLAFTPDRYKTFAKVRFGLA